MSNLRKHIDTAGSWAAFGAIGAGIFYATLRLFLGEFPSRWIAAGGLVLLSGTVAVLWKRLSPWSRVSALAAYPVFLIGALAAWYSPRDAASFAVGPVGIVELVNGVVLLALGFACIPVWRMRRAPIALRAALTAGLLVCASPYFYGTLQGIALPDLVQGEALAALPFELPSSVPLFARPSVVAFTVCVPLAMLWLVVQCVRAGRGTSGSVFRRALALLAAGVPVALGAQALIATSPTGLAARVFDAASYQDFASERIDPAPAIEGTAGSPGPLVVEWEGRLRVAQPGPRSFRFEGDGEGFLYLDGRLVIARGQREGRIELEAGDRRIRVATVQAQSSGSFALLWKRPEETDFARIPENLLAHSPGDLGWTRNPRQAAQAGVDWLQSSAVGWQRYNKCFGCHVQAQALMGLSIADANQYEINETYYTELHDFTVGAQHEDGSYHRSLKSASAQYAAMAMAYVDEHIGNEEDPVLERAVAFLVDHQDAAGFVPNEHEKAPIDQGTIMTTSNGLVALGRVYETTGDERFAEAHGRALDWLAAAEPKTTQDVVLKILGLVRDGGSEHRGEINELVERLRRDQEEDGGWREDPGTAGSNAYATGQALYALKLAGVSVNDGDFKRGVLYLLETQNLHGSWPGLNTRGDRTEFGPTMWAVIGLAGSFGAIIPELQIADACELVEGEVDLEVAVTNYTDSPISDVSFEVDGAPVGPVEDRGEGRWGVRWNSDLAARGPHRIRVVVSNRNGESADDNTTVYTGGPFTVSIASPGETLSPDESATCVAEVANPAQLPIEGVGFYLDGAEQPIASLDAGPWQVPCDIAASGEGEHRLRAVVAGCGFEAEDEKLVSVESAAGPGFLDVQLGQEDRVVYVPPSNVELVLDMSGSMWAQKDGVAKYQVARNVLAKTLERISPDSNLALRVYGHRSKTSCTDSELLIPAGPFDPADVLAKIDALRPRGKTPIGRSLRAVAKDVATLEGSKAVVLISDGIETCDGDPAEEARALVEAGLSVKVHVVAFDVKEEPEAVEQLRKVAEYGGGRFFMAESADELAQSLLDAVQVTYSVFDAEGNAVVNQPVGEGAEELMSGSYRVRIEMDPPLELNDVKVEKGETTRLDVVREGEVYRIRRRAT